MWCSGWPQTAAVSLANLLTSLAIRVRKSYMKKVLIWWIWWRVGLLIVALAATGFIGFFFPYPNFEWLIELGRKIPLVWTWGGFDGIHYLTIAENGYIAEHTQAFFPVFPQLIRLAKGFLGVNILESGLIVANLASLTAVLVFWRLLRLDYSEALSRRMLWLFLLFPTSFYLVSVYSEGIFLALVFLSFLAARKGNWLAAGLIGAVAGATRPVGVFLLPALLVEYWQQRVQSSKFPVLAEVKPRAGKVQSLDANDWINLFLIFLVPLGLGAYMIYLQQHFGDALMFLHSQPAFGADRSDKIVLLYQVLWRYIKMLMTVQVWSLLYFRVVQELVSSLVFLILGIVSFKKVRLSYAVFAILSFITPTLTGTFSSMPRYVLVMFPAFIVLGQWFQKHRRLRWAWWGSSVILLVVDLSLFLTGRWVA